MHRTVLLFLVAASANAQVRFQTYTTDNGLPHNSVLAIRQAKDGYVWFTTYRGLVRFDGAHFQVFDSSNTPAIRLTNFATFSLTEDRHGALWAGAWNSGALRYRNGLFTAFTTKDGLPNNQVVRIDEDARGTHLDLHMPKLDGFSVAAEIRKSNLQVDILFLIMHDGVDLLHRAMDLGGKGYILKESALVEIVNAVRSVIAGRPYVSPSMTAALLERRTQADGLERTLPGLGDLTPSERRVLGMIAAGKPTKIIATELHVHPRTVESHRAAICHKLQLNGPNALLRFAPEHKSELLS
jgi:DNA-binding NarL/FixJ family response regulator